MIKSIFSILSFFSAFSVMAAITPNNNNADWTLLIYMNGDNNLSYSAEEDVEQMKLVGSTDRVHIVVLRDSFDQNETTKITHIEKGKETLIKDFGRNIDSGDWKELVNFFKETSSLYPARQYMLSVWNHGNGWIDRLNTSNEKGISYDDHSNNRITTKQLGLALKEISSARGKKLDLFTTDACLMQMVEVAYEIKDSVELIGGSEQTSPSEGWDYEALLKVLVKKPQISPSDLGLLVAQEYIESYRSGRQEGENVTYSILSVPELSIAVESLALLVPKIQTNLKRQDIFDAYDLSQTYDNAEYVDLLSFLGNLPQNDEIKKEISEVKSLFKKAIRTNLFWGSEVKDSTGLSIWLPMENNEILLQDYKGLLFNSKVKWSDLIRTYLH